MSQRQPNVSSWSIAVASTKRSPPPDQIAPANSYVNATTRNAKKILYCNTIDIKFTAKTSDPRISPSPPIVKILLALRENDPTCKFYSADRSVEWKSTSDLPSDEKELKKQLQYK